MSVKLAALKSVVSFSIMFLQLTLVSKFQNLLESSLLYLYIILLNGLFLITMFLMYAQGTLWSLHMAGRTSVRLCVDFAS